MVLVKDKVWDFLVKGAEKRGISLGEEKIEPFFTYLKELKEWSKKVGLTSLKEDRIIILKHFLDSLTPLPYIPPFSFLLDIGSGGGFPGIPLKIVEPSLQVTLLDSSLKRVYFQKHIIRILRLTGIQALTGRAEEIISSGLNPHSFDIVISRAFAPLGKFLQIGEPYLKKGGKLIVMKGKKGRAELEGMEEGLKKSSLKISRIEELTLPYLNHSRTLIIIEKD